MYKRIKNLGKGTFGLVYKAEYINNPDKFVAIKKYTNITKKDIPYQVLREINVIKYLKHPNIIEIIDVVGDGYGIELIMEFGGDSLKSYSKKISYIQRIYEIKNISYQLIMGCLYMHKLGIIHRDLKPDNILVNVINNQPKIKICDFGLAKKLPPFKNKLNSYQACTLNYRPPELFTINNQNYNYSVDIWSLGCLLYEFVTQEIVFEGSSDLTVLKNILTKIPVTQQDLDILGLDVYKLNSCNNDKYYKLSPLYNISFKDTTTMEDLDEFKLLIQSMLVLNPSNRINLDIASKSKYFESVTSTHKELYAYLDANRIKNYYNFYVRKKLPKVITEEQRKTYISFMYELYDKYDLNEQTALIAINAFDQFIGNKKNLKETQNVLNNLKIISACCVIAASKYIDIKPLNVKNLKTLFLIDDLMYWERIIMMAISFDLNQPTLLNFYKELLNDNYIVKNIIEENNKIEICYKHWNIIKNITYNYNILINKNNQDIKEILLTNLRQ